jgi:hypothetical protein
MIVARKWDSEIGLEETLQYLELLVLNSHHSLKYKTIYKTKGTNKETMPRFIASKC